jgi:mannose-1-phosphate guanylyltransferase / phosphomannomutase
MKALLICPAERPAVRFLAQTSPLACLHAFGKPLLAHWLEHLSRQGAKQVRILATDRPEHIRALVGDGARWGLQVEVISEPLELAPAEARAKHIGADASGWLAQPNDVSLIDSFPGLPEHPLFKSYANWFNALRAWLPRANAAGCNDAAEVKPGIWVSARARVSTAAELRAPCWIGPHTVVAADTIIGPMAVLEDRVMVESHVEISNSAVLPQTFIGKMTELKNSVADGSILINWRSASCTRVPDAFLMCSLAKRRHVVKSTNWFTRLAALFVLGLTLPLALIPILWAKLRRQPVTRPLVAVRPYLSTEAGMMATIIYHELTRGFGWLRCWPQLWSICRGEFAWVGNRPLSPTEVADLSNDFERLWLAAPIGLLSLGQAEGAVDALEKRACASLYALQANWRLDLSIIARALLATTKRSLTTLF